MARNGYAGPSNPAGREDLLSQIGKSQHALETRMRALQMDLRKSQLMTQVPLWRRWYDGTIGHYIRGGGASTAIYSPLEEGQNVPKRVAEHAWETVENRIFFPVGFYKSRWDLVVLFLIIYSAVMVPYRSCFHADPEGGIELAWEISVTILFLVDVIMTFNTVQQVKRVIQKQGVGNQSVAR